MTSTHLPVLSLEIDMGIPGWVRYQEIVKVCKYIADNGYTDVLEAGPFAGRLTGAICKSMPEVNVTAIDTFNDLTYFNDYTYGKIRSKSAMTCSDIYVNEYQTKEHFDTLHKYPNLRTIAMDVFDYHAKHQLVIIQMNVDNSAVIGWHDIFDHCMSLSTSATIGVLSTLGSYEESTGRKTLDDLYDFNIIDPGEFAIYELTGRKQP